MTEAAILPTSLANDRAVIKMTRQPISPSIPKSFAIVVQTIQSARQTAVQAVNTQLIDLYWQIGAYISQKLERAEWSDGSWHSWLIIWLKPSQDCVDLPSQTRFGYVSFMRLTTIVFVAPICWSVSFFMRVMKKETYINSCFDISRMFRSHFRLVHAVSSISFNRKNFSLTEFKVAL